MRKDERLENEQYANLRKLMQGHRRQTKFEVIDSHP